MHTPEEVKAAISDFPFYTDEQLIDVFKIITSMTTKKDKDLYGPALRAAQTERRKRGSIKTITSKPMQVKSVKPGQVNPDDYEAVEVIHDN